MPLHARNVSTAIAQYGDVGRAWVRGLSEGDPLADAFAADLVDLGRGPGMRVFRAAIQDGISSVDSPPDSLVALFDEVDVVPSWVDFEQLDRAGDHLARNSLQLGLVLAAASLMVGYTNPAAAYPLILTGRLVDNAGMRNLEVGDWLREVTTHGGMRRDGLGFERTLRVRVIHAMVRRHVAKRPEWDTAVLGTPISQPYMAHTLSEFGSIALAGMDLLGARYDAGELEDIYALWRYVGHLSGVSEALLPADEADQRRIQELYQLTRPPIDDDSRALVAGLVNDYLIPEVTELFPARMPALSAGGHDVRQRDDPRGGRGEPGRRARDRRVALQARRARARSRDSGGVRRAGTATRRQGSASRARPALPVRAGAATPHQVLDVPRSRGHLARLTGRPSAAPISGIGRR